ncbi:MAG: xanthine dehydrogenase family protein molybdopterin-binding subunit [Firmicutes bacterium]|nr:xanthine dehydrogenase family protein molybdopterin-binding subunit [Bacillota bacterium]
MAEVASWVGQAVPRLEDRPLIQGRGRYVSDIQFPQQWTMVLVRSPHAHAIIRSIDVSRARQLSGVHHVITAQDDEMLRQALPGMAPIAPPALAFERVFYVGQPVVAILADNRYIAEDARDLVSIDYQPLPSVTNVEEALAPRAVLHPSLESNVVDHVSYAGGQGKEALSQADVVIRATLRMGRVTAQPMEPRGLVAAYDPSSDLLTVYHATQSVHRAQERIADFLGIPRDRVRVIAPDVGGGFGVKNGTYSEEVLVSYFARRFQHPVKWVGDRFEEFLSTYQEREQTHHVELGVKHDGTIVAFVDTYYQDNGAFPGGGIMVSRNTARNLIGPYRIPHFAIDGYTVLTNKVPQGPYRGAGRPQGHYVIERMLDRAADQLGLDRAEIRLKNLVRPEDFPYQTGIPDLVYDSGNYPQAFQDLLELVDLPAFREEQRAARHRGVRLGLGLSAYVEISAGFGFEGARLELGDDGTVTLFTGATNQGQGHRTSLAQIAADTLGLDVSAVSVVEGDTGKIARGIGTFGSRTIIMAGNATRLAGEALIEAAKPWAAEILEAHAADIAFDRGHFFVKGVPQVSISWKAVAERVASQGEGPLTAEEYFSSNTATYGFGAHAVVVEIDEKTLSLRIRRYLIVHDTGTVVNPLLARGQVIGGTIQGLGTALWEEMLFNEDGQPLTTSFLDYLLPGSAESPDIAIYHRDYRAPGNPAGYKGVGEAGIIPSQAVILSAIEDAFRDRKIALDYAPVTPNRLFRLLTQGGDSHETAGL